MRKLSIFASAVLFAAGLAFVSISVSANELADTCGLSSCGGGTQQCCRDANGSTWFNNPKQN